MSENFSLLSTEYNSPPEVKRLRAIARLHFLSAVKRHQFIPLASVSNVQTDTEICILITDSKLQIRRNSIAVWDRVSLIKNLETVKIPLKLIGTKSLKSTFSYLFTLFNLQTCIYILLLYIIYLYIIIIYMLFIYLFDGNYCRTIVFKLRRSGKKKKNVKEELIYKIRFLRLLKYI